MSEINLIKHVAFEKLPPEWNEDLLPSIRNWLGHSQTKIVILDDDPTGTQTIHGLPVLTSWDVLSLKKEMQQKNEAFFILTNSRGLNRSQAKSLAHEIGTNLQQASETTGIKLSIISRSDSTLRGHFPHEVDETAKAIGDDGLPYLICPFFLEGGRYTINNIHYVAEGENLVPAARTAFAKDASFGFTQSDLCKWVNEKTKGKISSSQVIPVSLEDIRSGGPEQVTKVLMQVPDDGACIVNAVSYKDIEVVVTGLQSALSNGKRFLYRTAASFVRVFTGITPRSTYLSKNRLVSDHSSGGLFIVGSYVPKTTAQVNAMMDQTDVLPIKISVDHLLNKDAQEKEIKNVIIKVNAALNSGRDTLVYTSRKLVVGNNPEESLKIGQLISLSLIQIVKSLAQRPRYLVAKGGITSSDVATVGLNVKRAMVLGQALPGVPVWELGDESRYPGMSYIIFPGNVGDESALVQIQQNLKSGEPR